MPHELVQRAIPASLVTEAGLFAEEGRMREGELGALRCRVQVDLHPRLIGVLLAAQPAPAHDQALGSADLEVLAGALMLAAVEHPEPHPEAPADAHVGLEIGRASCRER